MPNFSPVRRLTTLTFQLPSDCLSRSRTSCPNSVLTPRSLPKASSCLDNEPKSTSVPASVQFNPTGLEKSRPAAISGNRRANSSALSMNSMVANSGLRIRVS